MQCRETRLPSSVQDGAAARPVGSLRAPTRVVDTPTPAVPVRGTHQATAHPARQPREGRFSANSQPRQSYINGARRAREPPAHLPRARPGPVRAPGARRPSCPRPAAALAGRGCRGRSGTGSGSAPDTRGPAPRAAWAHGPDRAGRADPGVHLPGRAAGAWRPAGGLRAGGGRTMARGPGRGSAYRGGGGGGGRSSPARTLRAASPQPAPPPPPRAAGGRSGGGDSGDAAAARRAQAAEAAARAGGRARGLGRGGGGDGAPRRRPHNLPSSFTKN